MKINEIKVKIKDLVDGYHNDDDSVVGYGGDLDIRPKYQREFVYKDKQRQAVIRSVSRGFPINVMHWFIKPDGRYEVLDGQQRTISICQYIDDVFSVDGLYFQNLSPSQKAKIMDYEITVHICDGAYEEKLEWFEIINIAGVKLNDQELRNAVYSGTWVTSARSIFSKRGCPAYSVGSAYMKGAPENQDYLQSVIKWISENNIEDYMGIHQNDRNANQLWIYFQKVIAWVEMIFPNYRSEMKGQEWGLFYNRYKDIDIDPEDAEEEIKELLMDDDVTNKRGIYHYILSGDSKYLNIRAFTKTQKRKVYEQQDGYCAMCDKQFDFKDTEADHIKPWSEGGRTELSNCQILCKPCNRRKSNK